MSVTQKQDFGTVSGSVQVGLRSGDVKKVAFTTVKMVEQDYQVLTPSEKEAIQYDDEEGWKAQRLGIISMDDASAKANAKVAAMKSLEARLPEKQALPAIATATTDENGNFRFDHIRPGTFWICLDSQIGVNWVGWSIKVEVNPSSASTINLNNTNVDYAFN